MVGVRWYHTSAVVFAEVQKQLRKFQKQPNPNLKMLARTILKHIEDAGEDTEGFRILVFVRTRATCRALCRWLNSQDVDEQLRLLNAQHFTGTGAHQEHGGNFASLTVVRMEDGRLWWGGSVCSCMCGNVILMH